MEKSIAIIGFMGVGKTTVGSLLSEKLNRTFIDVDKEIERYHDMKIRDMFKAYGEKMFRDEEKKFISYYAKQPGTILSLGGGAFLQEEIRDVCMEQCHVVFLDISWEIWKSRIDELMEDRPVLRNKTTEEIRQLFEERKSVYRDHHERFLTDGYTEEQVADVIIERLSLT
ncbi:MULTISPECIES: shikimate kinase [Salimicrobium]|uniref:Shikimate kinase n=2 Tax=Salimicrobium TaxID=351195 RepID=A0ABY1KY36_9BACI|nr:MULTISPECIES: shikimate kinase [Salimicrobium]SDY30390.1 shikimate kinase [Salimicrobium album]SIS91934.1 shikimate kinase [Salimicrobium salexigens]